MRFWKWLTRPWRLRKTAKQVSRGEIPVDYNRVNELQRQVNDQVLGAKHIGREDDDPVIAGLASIRMNVAYIRVAGYDQAIIDADKLIAPDDGVLKNPHDAGTGKAKQWVRGYCMGAGIPPKELMGRA